MTLAERLAGVTSGPAPPVEVGDTIRMLVDTGSTEHRAPDGGVKFRQGLIVRVDDVYLDAVSARRWVRNRIAEPFVGGTPGDIVTAEERTADAEDFSAEIARLERLRDRARERAAAPAAPVDPRRDPSLAIGREPYRVPAEERPLARYGLADAQIEALTQAGFSRPDIIDAATDEEILEVRGVGKPTLAKLRGRAE